MNKVILMGRLTRDPDVRVSNTADRQITVARYTLAVDRRAKRDGNDQTADFISCVAFDRAAEFAESKAAGQGLINRPSSSADAGDGFMNLPDNVDDEGLPFN